jgi:hypothetical protein
MPLENADLEVSQSEIYAINDVDRAVENYIIQAKKERNLKVRDKIFDRIINLYSMADKIHMNHMVK